MRKEISEKMEIPAGTEVSIEGNFITVRGSQGEVKRKFDLKGLKVHKEGNNFSIECKKATKNEKKKINSFMAHFKNMMEGTSKKFEYQLKICYSHFPITAEVKGKEMTIKNFLGERASRKLKIIEGADVDVDKEIITVKSINKEIAGQMSADIEKTTKINKRDRRVFQDGIFIINKAGKEI